MTPETKVFWDAFCATSGAIGEPFDIFSFGDSPHMADDLLMLVLSGQKRATATRQKAYEAEGMRLPKSGDLSIVLDGKNSPACIIRTVRADLMPFEAVPAEFAYVEGEGDRSLDYWRRVHLDYYERECAREGCCFDLAEMIVCERFDCVWTAEHWRALK